MRTMGLFGPKGGSAGAQLKPRMDKERVACTGMGPDHATVASPARWRSTLSGQPCLEGTSCLPTRTAKDTAQA